MKDTIPENGVEGERLVVKIAVEKVWKGKVGQEILMYTSEVRQPNGMTWTTAEDFEFEDGKQYLIYADGPPEKLRTTACTRSRELGKAADDLQELGEWHEPERK